MKTYNNYKNIAKKYRVQDMCEELENIALKSLVITALIVGVAGLIVFFSPRAVIAEKSDKTASVKAVVVPSKVKTMYFRCSDDLMKQRAEKTVQFECL